MTAPVDHDAQPLDLSAAWARAFLRVMRPGRPRLSPIVVSIRRFGSGGAVDEDATVRGAVDAALARHELKSVEDTAFTIFPYGVWSRRRGRPRGETFGRYFQMLPRIHARAAANRHGTYFERMVGFEGVRQGIRRQVNQLDHLLSVWERDAGNGTRTRPLALQVGILDPAKDHDGNPRRGFPCLQQVGFDYDDEGGLAVNAFYPTQHVFDRGYGNYLGLCRLGQFMAHEMKLELVCVNCYVGNPGLSNKQIKTALKPLAASVAASLGEEPPAEEDES